MKEMPLTSIITGLMVCILLLEPSTLCETSLLKRHGPRHLLQTHATGTSAANIVEHRSSSASRVEHLVLWHRPSAAKLNATFTRPATTRNGSVPVSFSVYYPAAAINPQQQQLQGRLPILFLLNGANVEAEQYSTLARLLNNQGYVFVASNLYQPLSTADQRLYYSPGPAKNWTLPVSCPRDKLLGPSAALIQTFVNHVRSQASPNPALQHLEQRGLVLVGHSMGGTVASNILGNRCSATKGAADQVSGIDFCQGYQPPLRTTACSDKNTRNTFAASHLTAHSSSTPASIGLIRGVVVYEGYRSQPAPQSEAHNPAALTSGSAVFLPVGEAVPAGMFLLMLSGQYGAPKVQRAYKLSNASSCSCVAIATFAGLNHFGINNYQPNTTAQGVRQLTPCGHPATSDPVNFRVTEALQDKQLQNMASLIDTFIKAQVLGDTGAKQQLQQVAATSSSRQEFKLQAKPGCLA